MTAEELANRIAALRLSLDEKIERAKANDEEAREHLNRLNEMGLEIDTRRMSRGERVDFYTGVWWEFEKQAREMLMAFFKLPEKGSTEIVIDQKAAAAEPPLRPGYDVPRAHK